MRQQPGGRSWCTGHGRMLLTGLLLMACSACFLIEPRNTSPGVMALPRMDWISINHQLRKYPTGLCTAQSHRGIFSIEVPSSLMTLPCVKMTCNRQHCFPTLQSQECPMLFRVEDKQQGLLNTLFLCLRAKVAISNCVVSCLISDRQ